MLAGGRSSERAELPRAGLPRAGLPGTHRPEKLQEFPAVDLNEKGHSASLAMYRVMLASTFCLHIGGDSPTRKYKV